jgi:hypothetical protein
VSQTFTNLYPRTVDHSTLAASTEIILFSEILNLQKNIKEKKIVKENIES